MPKLAFTKAAIAAAVCPSDKTKVDFFDTNLRSFGVEVRAGGNKTYFVRYYDAYRKKRQFKIGDANVVPLSDARAKAKDVLRKVQLGEDPVAAKAEKLQTPTLAAFATERYLPYAQRHKRSWKTDESLLRNHILPVLGTLHLSELTPSHFLQLQADLLDADRAPASVDRILILCRYICNCAIQWKTPGIKTNPTQPVRLLHPNNNKERFLSAEESRKLLAVLEKPEHAAVRPIVLLLFLTGARRGEVLNARFDEFDLERRVWRIPITKSGRPRDVPLSQDAVEIVRAQQRLTNGDFVCPNPTTGKPFVGPHKPWKRVCKDAGMPELRLHDLRHSFASFLVNNGRTLYEVQRILGHHSIRVTERYSHLTHEALLDAAEAVGAVYAAARPDITEKAA